MVWLCDCIQLDFESLYHEERVLFKYSNWFYDPIHDPSGIVSEKDGALHKNYALSFEISLKLLKQLWS